MVLYLNFLDDYNSSSPTKNNFQINCSIRDTHFFTWEISGSFVHFFPLFMTAVTKLGGKSSRCGWPIGNYYILLEFNWVLLWKYCDKSAVIQRTDIPESSHRCHSLLLTTYSRAVNATGGPDNELLITIWFVNYLLIKTLICIFQIQI